MVLWYYVDGAHTRHGPITAEALAQAFRQGRVRREDLVWREGMAQWEPLEGHLGELPAPAAPPAVAPAAPPATPGHVPPAAAPAGPAAVPVDHVVDAGFWRRLGGYLIDSLLLGTVYYIVLMVGLVALAVATAGARSGDSTLVAALALAALAYALLSYFYYVGMERSKLQASVGKLAMGIKVVDADGRRLGWGQASLRWAGSILSYLIIYIGFFMAGWTRRKQTLHDLMAKTHVVDKWAYSDQPGRQKDGLNGVVVAVVAVVIAFGLVMVLAILAAIALPAYQDYIGRSKLATVMAEGREHRLAVAEFQANTDRCPRDAAEAGLAAPRSPGLAEVLVIDSETGGCDLALVLGRVEGLRSAEGGVIYLRDDGQGGSRCEAEGIPDKYLPSQCK